MTRVTTASIVLSIVCLAYDTNPVLAKRNPGSEPLPTVAEPTAAFDDGRALRPSFAVAAPNTTVLYSASFDVGGTCSSQGWTVVDLTEQLGAFWHVEDYAGLSVGPLQGAKSLWCGARPQVNGAVCGYLTLPGYGNNWDQAWCTTTCIPVDGTLDVSFMLRMESEPGYDFLSIETNTHCTSEDTWTPCIGGDCGADNRWDGALETFVTRSYPVASSSLRVRFRFESDPSYSDQDGEFDTQAGAVHIDNLTIEGLPVEDFEDEGVGSTLANHWATCNPPGYGASAMALFPGVTLLQQDACAKNLSCVWAAINGSTEVYSCGDYFPSQAAVPHGNARGQYLHAAISSPPIALVGSGSVVNLQFSVYRDNPLESLVFYMWNVRSYSGAECKDPWKSRGFVYYGGQKDWIDVTYPVGDLIAPGATTMEVALEVVDQCEYWCGVFGLGFCKTHAPLLDNVRVYRVDVFGPLWTVRDIDMFQDTFPFDGTRTGLGRADMARSITSSSSPTILPGDSVVLICVDPITAVAPGNPSGLASDPGLGGKQIYLYVHCSDPAKSGAVLTSDPAHYPFKDTIAADGRTWTRIRCEQTQASSGTQFRVDLNDALFEGGDVIEFFFGATNTNGETSYCSGSSLSYVQSDLDEAARNASEFTILPRNNFILYVDGMDGRGSQPYWDTAFEQLGIAHQVDRYDIRGPSSMVANRPGARVSNVEMQLNTSYNVILWDGGDLSNTLGDGTGGPEKSNDYAMLNTFLYELGMDGGVYICGDDAASSLNSAVGASAVTFRSTNLPFTLTTGNHRPNYGINPIAYGVPGGAFDGDSFVVAGGCPLLNDFDVMAAAGASVAHLTYGPEGPASAAVLSKITAAANALPVWSTVVLSGFSFGYVRDDESDGVMDRAEFLFDVLRLLRAQWGTPPTHATSARVTLLEQNYPNPFNPVTTIAFSLASRTRVRIDVFNVAGERVKTLLDETRAAGAYSDVRWDGSNATGEAVASGVYFYKLTTKDFSQTRKMVLLK